MVEKLVPGSFIKKITLGVSLDQHSDMLKSLFLWFLQVEIYQNILKLICWPFAFALCKAFWKKSSGTSHPTSFSAWILKKSISPDFIAWLFLILETLSNACIGIIYCPVYDVINFEINDMFLIKQFFYITKTSREKCKYLKKEKSF